MINYRCFLEIILQLRSQRRAIHTLENGSRLEFIDHREKKSWKISFKLTSDPDFPMLSELFISTRTCRFLSGNSHLERRENGAFLIQTTRPLSRFIDFKRVLLQFIHDGHQCQSILDTQKINFC